MTASSFADTGPSPATSCRLWRGRELLRYFACSGFAFVADLGLYALCLRGGLSYATAATVGFSAGLMVIYAASRHMIFKVRRMPDERLEFGVFAGIGLLGLILTQSLLWALIDAMQVPPVPAKLATAAAVFGFNFSLRKVLLFTARNEPSA